MEQLWIDLRYAARTLWRSPGFCAVAVLSLGLGIGANTAIFSLIHALLLRPLPVENPDQIVLLTDPDQGFIATDTSMEGDRPLLAYPEFERFRAQNRVFSGMAAMASTSSDIEVRVAGRDGHPKKTRARAQLVSGEFFGLLGVKAAVGRAFGPAEDRVRGGDPVAVISYAFWQRELSGDPAVLERTLLVGRSGFRVIGVAPREFRGALVGWPVDIWAPITMQAELLPGHDYLTPRDTLWLQVLARLEPGVTRATAQAGINVVFQQWLKDWAAAEKLHEGFGRQRIVLRDGARGTSSIRGQFGDPLAVMMAMVGLVLLIACGNIANLTMARASGRTREIGVRLALGAGRGRLIRQMVTESLLVAALGGMLGALLAMWGADLLAAMAASASNGIAIEGQRDLRVLVFTAAISTLAGVLFGLWPAWRASRVDVNRSLAAGVRGSVGTRSASRIGKVLVVSQVALSVLLVMGAALFARSLYNMTHARMGYARERIAMARIDPWAAGYKGAAVGALYRDIVDRLSRVPGVRGVTLSNTNPYGGDSSDQVSVEGVKDRGPEQMHSSWTLVGPNYFSTMGIPLLRGREISTEDFQRGSAVCVVNQTLVRYFFPNGDPIGKHITDEYPTTRTTYEIIGVAADAAEYQLGGKPERRFYGSLAHPIGIVGGATALVRADGDPARVLEPIRKAVAGLDPMLEVRFLRTVDAQLGQRLTVDRVIAELAAFFGGLALLMAAVGLYGLMSYSVSRRTGEIGLRMALGASEGGVLRMVIRETLWMVAAGIAVGLPCAVAAAKLIEGVLEDVSPADPVAMAVAVVAIAAAGVVAAYVPARRAARIDPIQALRFE